MSEEEDLDQKEAMIKEEMHAEDLESKLIVMMGELLAATQHVCGFCEHAEEDEDDTGNIPGCKGCMCEEGQSNWIPSKTRLKSLQVTT